MDRTAYEWALMVHRAQWGVLALVLVCGPYILLLPKGSSLSGTEWMWGPPSLLSVLLVQMGAILYMKFEFEIQRSHYLDRIAILSRTAAANLQSLKRDITETIEGVTERVLKLERGG